MSPAPFTSCPIYTEVNDLNQVRRTFRQIKKCFEDLEVEPAPTTPGEIFQASNKKLGQQIGTAAATVQLDKVNVNTDSAKFGWDANIRELTINADGRYDFDFKATMQDEGTQVSFSIWLEKYDPVLGIWLEVEGTRAFNHTKA